MRDWYMTKAEIADELGISEDAVKAILARVMRKIRIAHPELAAWLDE